MFSLFSRRQLTDEQSRLIHRRCHSVLKAYVVCQKANAADPSPCVYLENSAVSCVSEICCRSDLLSYEKCVKASKDDISFRKCDVLLTRMKRCLERYGQYPF